MGQPNYIKVRLIFFINSTRITYTVYQPKVRWKVVGDLNGDLTKDDIQLLHVSWVCFRNNNLDLKGGILFIHILNITGSLLNFKNQINQITSDFIRDFL